MPEFTGTRDVRGYLRIVWRWKLLILFFVVAAPLAAYLIEHGKPNEYKASALVGVNQTTVNTSLLNNGGSFSTSNVTAIAELVTTTPVADVAASLLHPPANAGQIASEVSATGDSITNFLTITAQDRSPVRAAQIANAFAHAVSSNLQQSAVTQIDSTIKGIQAQLAQLSPNNTTTRPGLEQQLNQLKASKATQGSEAAILQAATPSATPVGTTLRRSIELAVVIGLLLAFGAVVLAEGADRKLRSPDDLEGMTDLPLLASIAPSAFSGKLETSREDDEAFQMLRTALTYFNVDRLDSVVITSAGEKEGKTTVATRLALVAACAGQRVFLIDADLRRGQASARLALQTRDGLGAVLAGSRPLADVLVEYDISDTGAGRLSVLPSGPPPPNPAALISSPRMHEVLRELEAQSDLVIVDTPAALAVSDPVALMASVSGVVLVARMNRSSRHTIRRLQQMIESAHGKLLGVVATGVTAGQGYYEHYATKYYAQGGTSNGNGHRSRLRLRRAETTSSKQPTLGD
jgi:non-specific protein-tyrosine kinase